MIYIQSILVYTLLAILMSFFTKLSINNRNSVKSSFLFMMPIALYTLVFGLRYGVGMDYFTYESLYTVDKSSFRLERLEPGFNFFMELCHGINMPVVGFMALTCFIQIAFIYATLSNSKQILIYLPFTLILSGVAMIGLMNGIRQVISWTMFLFSLTLLVANRKRVSFLYIPFILLAASFHRSALILLPFYFLRFLKFDKQFPVLWFLILYIITFLLQPFQLLSGLFSSTDFISIILGFRYDNYLGSEEMEFKNAGIGIADILSFLMWIFIIRECPKMINYFNNRVVSLLLCLGISGVILNNLCSGSLALMRIVLYFHYCSYIVLAIALYYFTIHKRVSAKNYIWFFLIFSFMRVIYYGFENTSLYVSVLQPHLYHFKPIM